MLVLLNKLETDLVHVARALAGVDRFADQAEVLAPRQATLRGLRRLARFFPFYRALGAVELPALAVIAALADTVVGSLIGTQALTVALVVVAVVVTGGHLLSVLTSSRLR